MMIEYVSLLVFLLAAVTWASSIDIKENIDELSDQLNPLHFTPFINEALKNPEISSRISSSSHAILSSFSSQNEYAVTFYKFVLQKYDFRKHGFDSEDPHYWNALINISFRDFSRLQAEQAQVIINQIVIPRHPFLSQIHFTFQTTHFLDQFIPDIDVFLDQAAKKIFAEHFSQILALENLTEAEILLKALLRKAKTIFCNDPEYKYHHAFLVNVPFHYFKGKHLPPPDYYNDISSYISHLAPALHRAIVEHSKAQADEILVGILPSRYSNRIDRTYENTIREYKESYQQPIDLSYLWDPQHFSGSVLAALQNTLHTEDSHFAPYLTILQFISQDSPLAYLFRHYIAQSYYQPSNLPPEHLSLLLRSIIFSSFSVFPSLLPNHSNDIIQLLFPTMGMDQIQSQLVHGLVNDQFSSDVHFPLVAGWGHTSTVQLILEFRTDICDRTAGSALAYSAQGGHIDIVNLLLQSRVDIDAGRALRCAAHGGHTEIVNLLLQSRVVISADEAASALAFAAQGGHIAIVNLLLRDRVYISTEGAIRAATRGGYAAMRVMSLQCWADTLRNAVNDDHAVIIEILLKSRADLSADDGGSALQYAAQIGHTAIVEIILQRRSDISVFDVNCALRIAAQNGHTAIIEILQRHADPSVFDAGLAFRNAAACGHIYLVNILQHRYNISAADAGLALRNAAACGYIETVNLLLQDGNISADVAGMALCSAVESGHNEIIVTALKAYIESRS